MSIRTSLTMIVKDESSNLMACLASVRGIVDEIIVVDTGSTDHTKSIAAKYGAHIFDLVWPESFAVARNETLSHATGDWILWLDADEYLDQSNRDSLHKLLSNLSDDHDAYAMKCLWLPGQAGRPTVIVDYVRLFRNHPSIRWEYRVHEQILPAIRRAGHEVKFTDITIAHTGYQDPVLRYKKLERNLKLLHLDQADRPNDPFTLFSLGCSYAELGHHAEAIKFLQESLLHSSAAEQQVTCEGVFPSVDANLRCLLACHDLAVLNRMEGQDDNAEFYWKAALSNKPTFLHARLGLAELVFD